MFANSTIMHSYPHCWRCKGPVIFRGNRAVVCSVEGFRKRPSGYQGSKRFHPGARKESATW